MDKKLKLNTAVERVVHDHVNNVKDGTRDFVILYLRRNNVEVDRDSLTKILDVVEKAIQAQHMEKVDHFMTKLDKAISDFVE